MLINTYDVTLETMKGDTIDVSLRISLASQIRLKKKFNESTTETMFTAIDDPEKFAAVLDEALSWDGNQNPVKRGTELADLMAMNGLLGVAAKQRLITKLAVASGILDENERASIDAHSDAMMEGIKEPKKD